MFCDVSGFTKLAEAMAKSGMGAEGLAKYLNQVYSCYFIDLFALKFWPLVLAFLRSYAIGSTCKPTSRCYIGYFQVYTNTANQTTSKSMIVSTKSTSSYSIFLCLPFSSTFRS